MPRLSVGKVGLGVILGSRRSGHGRGDLAEAARGGDISRTASATHGFTTCLDATKKIYCGFSALAAIWHTCWHKNQKVDTPQMSTESEIGLGTNRDARRSNRALTRITSQGAPAGLSDMRSRGLGLTARRMAICPPAHAPWNVRLSAWSVGQVGVTRVRVRTTLSPRLAPPGSRSLPAAAAAR